MIWRLREDITEDKISELASKLNIKTIVAKILLNRGFDFEEARIAVKDIHEAILDPELLTNAKEAAEVITRYCRDEEAEIWIFGDYDCDGIGAGYVLGSSLMEVAKCPVNVYYPERSEHYGLNMNFCERIVNSSKGKTLLITVDNGINQLKEIAYLQENNVEVVVTDHHVAKKDTPNCIIVDPHNNGEPDTFKHLSGCGVAFKVAQLVKFNFGQYDMEKYTPYVALTILSDIMPLSLENIAFIKYGLDIINSDKCPKGIQILKNYIGKQILTSTDLVWDIAPRVNACGRMGNINLASKLFFIEGVYEKTDESIIKEVIEGIKDDIKQDMIVEAEEDIINKLDADEFTEDEFAEEVSKRLAEYIEQNKEVMDLKAEEIIKAVPEEDFKEEVSDRIIERNIIQIEKLNTERKGYSDQAKKLIETLDYSDHNICIMDATGYPEGVIGIIAGKLSEKFNKPSIVVGGTKDTLKGSARSVEGILLQELLQKEMDKGNIVEFGGHDGAAGVTINRDKLQALQESLDEEIGKIERVVSEEPEIFIDEVINIKDINEAMYEMINTVPYDNKSLPSPVFALLDVEVMETSISKKNPDNIKFKLRDGGRIKSIWAWGMAPLYESLGKPERLHIAGYLERDFMNVKTLTLKIVDFMGA